MKREEDIIIGDKVDLLGHQNRLYRTMIEDITENRFLLVGVPRFGGVPMPIRLDENVFMVFYRESGRFITEMRVVRFENRGDVRYIWLYQKTEPVKNQRRDAFRVPIIIDVSVCEYIENMEDGLPVFGGFETVVLEATTSRDISITGMSIVSSEKLELGDKRLLKMFLKWPSASSPPFHVCAVVKRCLPWRDSGKSILGLSFLGQTKDMTEYISKYVLEEQRRQLKQKRLIEN